VKGVPLLIAIDGPGASGKSTVGRLVAQKIGYRFIDTGAMYRALTWLALHLEIDLNNDQELSHLAANSRFTMDLSPESESHHFVFIDFHSEKPLISSGSYEVSQEIHSSEVETNVSRVSEVAGVRQALVAQQREMSTMGKVVMVGRDIGTVVLPEAGLKIFLTASAEERAQRRYLTQPEKGYSAILADLKRRDEIDSQRFLSPLLPAEDAQIIETEGFSPEEVAQQIISSAQIS
jgi:cytidylate kinase